MTSLNETTTKTSAVAKLFALASYIGALLVMTVYFLVFLMPSAVYLDKIVPANHHVLPYISLDKSPSAHIAIALVVDLLLLVSFGFFHSLLARPRTKAYMKIPVSVERSFYLMQSNVFLVLQMVFWRDFGAPTLWNGLNIPAVKYSLVAINLGGYLFLVTSTFALDHFHLFGLSQAFGTDINAMVGLGSPKDENDTGNFVNRWHYKVVAHPIMTGALTMFWATPYMTMPRFLVAIVMTLYIGIGVCHFEEPDLKKELGAPYAKYLNSVPRFVPGLKRCKVSTDNQDQAAAAESRDGQTSGRENECVA